VGAETARTQGGNPSAVQLFTELIGKYRAAEKAGIQDFSLLDREWDLLPGVYSPACSQATRFSAEHLPYPRGGTLLEIGCGSGVIAVHAALNGCAAVTAVDIVPAAVANTRLNADRHGVGDRIRVLRGDVFDALYDDDRFDAIFWNAPYQDSAKGVAGDPDLMRAYVDPEYRGHAAYLSGARRHLRPGGRLFLGFGSAGNREKLDLLLAENGWRGEIIAIEHEEAAAAPDGSPDEPAQPQEHMLMELLPLSD
jgi:release factor glutamine methyltransferase